MREWETNIDYTLGSVSDLRQIWGLSVGMGMMSVVDRLECLAMRHVWDRGKVWYRQRSERANLSKILL